MRRRFECQLLCTIGVTAGIALLLWGDWFVAGMLIGEHPGPADRFTLAFALPFLIILPIGFLGMVGQALWSLGGTLCDHFRR